MEEVKAMCLLGIVGGVLLFAFMFARKITNDEAMSWTLLLGVLAIAMVGGVFLVLKQKERVMHLQREDYLYRMYMAKAMEIQHRMTGVPQSPGDDDSGMLLALLGETPRGQHRLPKTIDVEMPDREAGDQ